MKDRVVQYPNRFTLTQISGNTYDITPAPGVVTEQGTDLNKATLLSDTAAASIEGVAGEFEGEPTPSEAFGKIAGVLAEPFAKIYNGSYAGTDTYGSENKTTINLPFAPSLLIVLPSNGYYGIFVRGLDSAPVFRLHSTYQDASVTVTWSETSVSWYGDNAPHQLNTFGLLYHFTAIGR